MKKFINIVLSLLLLCGSLKAGIGFTSIPPEEIVIHDDVKTALPILEESILDESEAITGSPTGDSEMVWHWLSTIVAPSVLPVEMKSKLQFASPDGIPVAFVSYNHKGLSGINRFILMDGKAVEVFAELTKSPINDVENVFKKIFNYGKFSDPNRVEVTVEENVANQDGNREYGTVTVHNNSWIKYPISYYAEGNEILFIVPKVIIPNLRSGYDVDKFIGNYNLTETSSSVPIGEMFNAEQKRQVIESHQAALDEAEKFGQNVDGQPRSPAKGNTSKPFKLLVKQVGFNTLGEEKFDLVNEGRVIAGGAEPNLTGWNHRMKVDLQFSSSNPAVTSQNPLVIELFRGKGIQSSEACAFYDRYNNPASRIDARLSSGIANFTILPGEKKTFISWPGGGGSTPTLLTTFISGGMADQITVSARWNGHEEKAVINIVKPEMTVTLRDLTTLEEVENPELDTDYMVEVRANFPTKRFGVSAFQPVEENVVGHNIGIHVDDIKYINDEGNLVVLKQNCTVGALSDFYELSEITAPDPSTQYLSTDLWVGKSALVTQANGEPKAVVRCKIKFLAGPNQEISELESVNIIATDYSVGRDIQGN